MPQDSKSWERLPLDSEQGSTEKGTAVFYYEPHDNIISFLKTIYLFLSCKRNPEVGSLGKCRWLWKHQRPLFLHCVWLLFSRPPRGPRDDQGSHQCTHVSSCRKEEFAGVFLASRKHESCTHCLHLHLLGWNWVTCPRWGHWEMPSFSYLLPPPPRNGQLSKINFVKRILNLVFMFLLLPTIFEAPPWMCISSQSIIWLQFFPSLSHVITSLDSTLFCNPVSTECN